MRVTRITLDADLGLIELKTGPGGDGDYVLLPLPIPKDYERYIAFDGPATVDSPAPFSDFVTAVQTGAAVRGGIKYPTPAKCHHCGEAHHGDHSAFTAWNEGYDAAIEEMGGTDYGIRPNPYSGMNETTEEARSEGAPMRVTDSDSSTTGMPTIKNGETLHITHTEGEVHSIRIEPAAQEPSPVVGTQETVVVIDGAPESIRLRFHKDGTVTWRRVWNQ